MYRIKFVIDGRSSWEDFWALKGINFNIKKGETLGLIGENGAGKSTVLKLIAGMLKPDRGEIIVSGRVSGLLELGAGFQAELTGRENIYLNAGLFGLTQSQIEEKYEEIVEFASLGKFINAPVKCYSQGMFVRLAFAIAIHVNPDILLIDDMFAVGDIYAQRKCINKIFELKEKGVTILIVLQDLEMLKRICSRGIFLREGIIIKDGPIETVSSYYTETVGDKKGISIVQRGPLGIVFNNGGLILKWKDETITCNLGVHNSMLISGREYLSKTAEWQIENSKPEEIIAIGKWRDIPVSQYWKINFLNEKEFLWEIMVQTGNEVFIEKIDTRAFFIDEYKSWFTLDSETNFPETFIHEMKGDCTIVDDSINSIVGFKSNNNIAKPLPTIIFDRLHDNTKVICQIGNTGSEISGRLIQYQVFSKSPKVSYIKNKYNRCFSTKLIFFGPEEAEVLKVYLEDTKQIMRESTIIRKDSLSIYCEDNKIEIYWQDKLLTFGIGLNTKFKCQDKDYSAQDGDWSIYKKNNEEAVITISWDDKTPFTQTWTLKLQSDEVILWKIEMNVDEKIKLRNKQVELVLSEEYEKWITQDERGNFARLERKGNAVPLNKYINDYIGVESVYKSEEIVLPSILFTYEDASSKVSYISKIKEEIILTTRLRYLEVDSKENFYTLPGMHDYFGGKISVGINTQAEDTGIKRLNKKSPIIRNAVLSSKLELNRLSVVFNYGKGKIFWKNIEFTKGLGMYSSVFSRGVWYDSSQAFWKIIKSDKDRLITIGRWPYIPLEQIWEIYLLNENTLIWKITKALWEDVILEREQVNIMLSDKYKAWFAHKQFHGRFPKIFSEHNGVFWDRLWCGDKILLIGTKKCKIKRDIFNGQFLPSIVFSCSRNCQSRYSVIENTDNLFQARLLQYELDLRQTTAPDKNKYFEGQIKIAT